MQVLKGANVTAQWYQDIYLGELFAYLEKACLHTTETRDFPGYSGGASAPNATYNPLLRSIRQHFENNRSARALRDPSDTPVRENRDRVWQLEIVAYSDYALARSVGGLWIGDLTDAHYTDIAWMLIQLHGDLALPLTSSIRWAEGQKTYVSGRRLTSSGWDACRGIATHFAVSGNTHWDAGGFFYSRLASKITQLLGGDTDMTPEEHNWLWSIFFGVDPGTGGYKNRGEIVTRLRAIDSRLVAVEAAVGLQANDETNILAAIEAAEIDPAVLAAALAPLLPPGVALTSDDVAAIAAAAAVTVNDELAARTSPQVA